MFSPPDNGQAGSGQDERTRNRLRTEGSFVSQHASFWEHQAPLISQHAAPSRPTGFSDRILAKFSQNEAATAATEAVASATDNSINNNNSNSSSTNDAPSSKRISARGRTDFGQLLQKFSKSESSNSEERSDGEAGKLNSGVTRHRSFVRRQEAEEKASSSGSDAERIVRRTPERSQSLKVAEKSSLVPSSDKTTPVAPAVAAASTKTKVESSSGRTRRIRSGVGSSKSGREPGSGNTSEDGGNTSSSSSSSRSGFKSDFMAKRMAGQKKPEESGVSSSRPTLASPAIQEVETSTNSNGSLTFTRGFTGSLNEEEKDMSSKSGHVSGGVLVLGGVTTTASTDSSVSLGLLHADESVDEKPASEEKKSPRSAFLTKLNQTPEKSTVHKEHEVGSLLRSLRSSRTSSRSPSTEKTLAQGSAALSQLASGHHAKTDAHDSSQDKVSAPPETTPSSKIISRQGSQQTKHGGVKTAGSHEISNSVNKVNGTSPDIVQEANKASKTTETTITSSSTGSSSTSARVAKPEPKTFASSANVVLKKAESQPEPGEASGIPTPGAAIKRSASLKEEKSVQRSDSFETKRKGILKRTSSLSKPGAENGSSFPVVDPQLAKILQQRKKLVGDVEEKVEEEEEDDDEENGGGIPSGKRRSRALSAAEEIEETLKYSQLLAAERGRDPEADEALKRTSVAERVFLMQNRIEEVEKSTSSALTSKSRSGGATPKSRPRSGLITPTQQSSLDESLNSSSPPPSSQQQQQQDVQNDLASSTALSISLEPSKTPASATSSKSSAETSGTPGQSTIISSVQSGPPASTTYDQDNSDKVSGKVCSPTRVRDLQTTQEEDPTVLSGPKLMEKLTRLADATEIYQERRKKFVEEPARETSGGTVKDSAGRRGRSNRAGDQGRYQTQPITVEEIQAADSLETVSAFRALVRKKSAVGALEQLSINQHVGYTYTPMPTATTTTTKQQLQQHQPEAVAAGKRQEFPQHLVPTPRSQRRIQRSRRRTLPVTAEELNSVPENQTLVTAADFGKVGQSSTQARDGVSSSRCDSGILSESSDIHDSTGSLSITTTTTTTTATTTAASTSNSAQMDDFPGDELEKQQDPEYLRYLVLDMDLGSHDPCRMSLAAKTSLFQGLEDKTKAERDKEKSASGARRYINRKKRERSQTMPITDDEVSSAAEMGEASHSSAAAASGSGGSTGGRGSARVNVINLPKPEVVNRSRPVSMVEGQEAEPSDDELTKLSLSEKVKLFSQLREKEKEKEKVPAKGSAPVNRRKNRKQASRFNTQPVTSEEVEKAAAFSRISPLAMSLVKPPDPEILKTLSFKDQRLMMAQHAEQCLSQASSRSQSRTGSVTSLNQSQPSSRRQSVTTEEDVTSALASGQESREETESKGILKVKSKSSTDVRAEVKSILKSDQPKEKVGSNSGSTHSILKHSGDDGRHSDSGDSEPRGILKRRASQDGSSFSDGVRPDVKGILKHGSSHEGEGQDGSPRSRSNSQPTVGILKEEGSSHRDGSDAQAGRKGILKGASSTEDNSPRAQEDSGSVSRSKVTGDHKPHAADISTADVESSYSHVDLRISVSNEERNQQHQKPVGARSQGSADTSLSAKISSAEAHTAAASGAVLPGEKPIDAADAEEDKAGQAGHSEDGLRLEIELYAVSALVSVHTDECLSPGLVRVYGCLAVCMFSLGRCLLDCTMTWVSFTRPGLISIVTVRPGLLFIMTDDGLFVNLGDSF
ncbi:supervillin-like [Plakobranchus ocellatus]|uniref:Supervillin-like n=1 Tax=Plakobranchus ocellatus TaxID=259542 RepID=A0AAV3ZVL4_9GAST|nr:supervillin-like [Plakobranchus ocellatus]